MADFTLPEGGIPDPDPPAPEPSTSAPPARPARIRSLPDRPVRSRPAGGIRSVPVQTGVSARLAGTDAAIYGGDMNWRRGIGVLWTLFALISIGEVCNAGLRLLTGFDWPDLGDEIRLTTLCGVFVALWFGWGWTRWVLAVIAALAGGRTLMLLVIISDALAGTRAHLGEGSPVAAFTLFLAVVLGTLYLILAAYLIFSADVLDFIRHRREEGRGWVVIPVALLLAGYWATMLTGKFVVARWLEGMRPAEMSLALETMETMAAHWDPAAMATCLDAEALKDWPPAGRENLMNVLRPLGPYLGPGDDHARVSIDYNPKQGGLYIRGDCLETARCREGRVAFSFLLIRPVFGSWRVANFSVGHIQSYQPLPAATPAPSPTP